MKALLDAVRTRLVPALVTSLGVVIIAAGLLSYADPASAGTAVAESPAIGTAAPTDAPSATIGAPDRPGVGRSGRLGRARRFSRTHGDASRAGRGAPAWSSRRSRSTCPWSRGTPATRYCNVAMFMSDLGQPGEGRATYLYAHARDGMFGPIYNLAIQQHNPKKMLGMIVQVYTSDNKLYLYEVRDYFLHALTMDAALAATDEELWLQTSEGPKGTPGKTQLRASLLSVGAADPQDAHPKAKPLVCG